MHIWSSDEDSTSVCLSLPSEQKRNTSLTYSNSLRELLQRKISTLEQQLRHHHADPDGPEHHGEEHSHGDEKEHHDDSDNHRSDQHESDQHESDHEEDNDGDHQDQSHHHHQDHQEGDGEHGNEAEGHSLVSYTGYSAPGKTGFHSTKLDSMLNQLHLAGTQTHTHPSRRNSSKIMRICECLALGNQTN